MSIELGVNGSDETVKSSPDTSLLYLLRDELGVPGPKFGCGVAECGACTVLANDPSMRFCVEERNLG